MSNTNITAADLHRIFSIHSVKPTDEFTAAAGADYGYVAAWALKEQDGDASYLIQYGNNGQSDYEIADDATDLAAWLESPDLDPLDALVQTANVRGESVIETATSVEVGPFYILRTRYWYGPTETSDIVRVEGGIDPIGFDTYEDAKEWIMEEEYEEYGRHSLSHNESGGPSHKIVAV